MSCYWKPTNHGLHPAAPPLRTGRPTICLSPIVIPIIAVTHRPAFIILLSRVVDPEDIATEYVNELVANEDWPALRELQERINRALADADSHEADAPIKGPETG